SEVQFFTTKDPSERRFSNGSETPGLCRASLDPACRFSDRYSRLARIYSVEGDVLCRSGCPVYVPVPVSRCRGNWKGHGNRGALTEFFRNRILWSSLANGRFDSKFGFAVRCLLQALSGKVGNRERKYARCDPFSEGFAWNWGRRLPRKRE